MYQIKHGDFITVTWNDGTSTVEKVLIQKRLNKVKDRLVSDISYFVIKNGSVFRINPETGKII